MIRAICISLVLLVAARPAVADDADHKAMALKLFGDSDAAYKAGEFEHAVELLRRAYDLYPEPLLLYNLARALEGMGDLQGAVLEYQRYLVAAPDVRDRGAIERRIAMMREQLAQRDQPHPPPPPPQPLPQGPPPASGQTTERPVNTTPFVMMGVGVAAIIGGGAFGYMSAARHDDAVKAPVQADAQRYQDRAETYALTANVMFVAGGAFAAGGLVWALINRAHHDDPPAGVAFVARHVRVGSTSVGLEFQLP
jgi:tetratricopeptide (TPR) repeat protein